MNTASNTILLTKKLNELEKMYQSIYKDYSSKPDGTLQISLDKNGHKRRFYLNDSINKKKYLSLKTEKDTISTMAQKEYDYKALKTIKTQINTIKNYIDICCSFDVDNILDSIHTGKLSFIQPIVPTWEATLKEWSEQTYSEISNIYSKEKELLTDRGELVRSKSEKIMADLFHKRGIPYHYEKPLFINNKTFFPDFTFLCKETRKEIYWEHFGMMDNPDYIRQFMYKINQYENNGIFLGDRLIVTFETSDIPLSKQVIELKINQFNLMNM